MTDHKSVVKRIIAKLIAVAISISVVAGMLWNMQVVTLAEGNTPDIEAISALLVDARRGQVIYSKAPDEPIKTAAANKLMAALIAIEKAEPDAMVTASKEAIGVEGAALNLTVGEKYSVKSLVYASVLLGANDAVKAISEYVGGGETGFVKLMNEYAAKLGMNHTHFTNTTGQFDEAQYTTANDIAILLRYAISNTEFNKVFSTQAKPWYDNAKTILMTNANNMFWNYEGTDGGILDTNNPKLQSIVTTATKNSIRLICILIETSPEKLYSDSMALFNYGFDNYRYGTLVASGSIQKTISVEGETVNLVPTADVHYIYPRGQNYIKNVIINVDQNKLKPPITKNSIVGIMTFTLLDETIINVELYPDKEILPKKTRAQILKERIEESKELLYVIAGLVVLEVILLLIRLIGFINKQFIKRKARHFKRH